VSAPPDRPLDRGALRAEYRAFLRPGRVLLTGHSHQAWPDAARDALGRAFDDAAEHVDDKWERAVFPLVDRVGRRVLERLGFAPDDPIAFGRSTHELVVRLLSALPRRGPLRVVTTTGEFHSLHRQLRRLEEEGAEVTWVEARPAATLAERLAGALRDGTHLVAVSAVLFEDASIVRGLGELVATAAARGVVPLVDAYHAFDVVPLAWGPAADAAYVVAGGYKYAQFGEGVCFLRFPRSCALRPVDTGWFADFEHLAGPRGGRVEYGTGGARFAGSTFDPTPFYRADAALAVFDRHGLDVARLRAISSRQTRRIVEALARGGATIASPRDDADRGGFVAVRSRDAGAIVAALRARGVHVDSRGDLVRLGPAPYLDDEEIDRGVGAFLEVARG
jgi:selenocysteine lyase/cysteine desulfurase